MGRSSVWSSAGTGASVRATHGEDFALRRAPSLSFGVAEQRARVPDAKLVTKTRNLWPYALPNPHPHKEIRALRLHAEREASLIYAVSTTELIELPCDFKVAAS